MDELPPFPPVRPTSHVGGPDVESAPSRRLPHQAALRRDGFDLDAHPVANLAEGGGRPKAIGS